MLAGAVSLQEDELLGRRLGSVANADQVGARWRAGVKERSEDLNGRRWRHAHMFGARAKKKGKYFPYYVCSKRMNTKECDQDYIRADYLEAAVIEDV